MEQYINKKFDSSTTDILQYYAHDGYEDLWKREIEELAKCRNYQQIADSDIIDPIIKTDFMTDIRGQYMTLVDARGGEFIITDIYPTLEIYPIHPNVNLHLHSLFPLSPTRLLILNHIMFRPDANSNPVFEKIKKNSKIKGNMIIPPKASYTSPVQHKYDDIFTYQVRKIYEDDVEYVNALQLNEAKVGIAFRNRNKIINSIVSFNQRSDTKQSYSQLEALIKS